MRTLLPVRNYDSIIAALAGAFLIFCFTRHSGIGVSPDSVTYISVATNLHEHGTLTDFNKSPLMDFPAGYPLFLSGCVFLTGGVPVLSLAPYLNCLLFGLLIYLAGWIMERFSFRSKWYKWTLLSLIVFSPCLLEVYSMLWSETLFMILLLLFFLFFRPYFLTHSTRHLLLLALLAGLASITRYAGITLIGAGGLLLLCDLRLRGLKKLWHLLLFGLVAVIPLAINLWRNSHATGTLTGFREKGIKTFGTNLQDFGSVFCDWMPFLKGHHSMAAVLGLFWILLFIYFFLRRLMRKERAFSYEHIATAYFIVYAVFMLGTATISRFQTLDSRLLSPLFLPWLWGSTCWIPVWTATWTPVKRIGVVLVVIVAALSFQSAQVTADLQAWEGVQYAGIPGYTEDSWRNSETIDFVRKNKDSLRIKSTLYSNAEDAIWFLTGVRSDMIPHRDFPRDVKEFLAEDHFYVIWFNDAENPDLLSIETIGRYKKLSRVLPFHDGTVYYFTKDSLASRAAAIPALPAPVHP